MWTKREKKGEKAYIYTFVQRRHSKPRHYWCSVYTLRRESRLYERHAVSSVAIGRTFLYKKKGVFPLIFTTLYTSGEHRKYMDKVLYQESMKLFIIVSFFPFCWLCLICYWVLTCQLWIECFCVVIYVLYTNIVHKMSLQRERERLKRDFRLLKKEEDSRSAIYILGGKCPEMINSFLFFFFLKQTHY